MWALKKLKEDYSFLFSLSWIIMLVVVSIIPYGVATEDGRDGNDQKPSLQYMSSGSSIYFLEKAGSNNKPWHEWISGRNIDKEKIYLAAVKKIDGKIYYRTLHSDQWMKYQENDSIGKLSAYTSVLGTDILGRDILSRLIIGTRVTILVGILAAALTTIIGLTLGLLAGYYGGWTDRFILGLMNIFWSIPTILIAMILIIKWRASALPSVMIICISIGLSMWVDIARLMRGLVLQWKTRVFIEASNALGFSHMRILWRHILPNVIPSLLVTMSSTMATAITLEAGLSYLGLGVRPPSPSWGGMLREYYGYLGTQMSYLAFIPGITIGATILALIFIGEGLRRSMNYRQELS